jgi:hypothetical protein
MRTQSHSRWFVGGKPASARVALMVKDHSPSLMADLPLGGLKSPRPLAIATQANVWGVAVYSPGRRRLATLWALWDVAQGPLISPRLGNLGFRFALISARQTFRQP